MQYYNRFIGSRQWQKMMKRYRFLTLSKNKALIFNMLQ